MLSGMGFAASLLLKYQDMKDNVVVQAAGADLLHASRGTYFYMMVAAAGVLTLFIMYMLRVLPAVPRRALPIPAKSFWFQDSEHKRRLAMMLQSWLCACGAAINTVLICLVMLNGLANHQDGTPSLTPYPTLLLIALFILLISVLSGPVRMAIKKTSLFGHDDA